MKSSRNKTLFITPQIVKEFAKNAIKITKKVEDINQIANKTILGSSFEVLKKYLQLL